MKAVWTTLGWYTVAWGLWIGNPFWNAFSLRSGLYDKMAGFMPEWAWGLHAIIIGVSVLVGVKYMWPRGIWFGYAAGVYHWILIGTLYGLGDWRNTGMITSFTYVVLFHLSYRAIQKKYLIGMYNAKEV